MTARPHNPRRPFTAEEVAVVRRGYGTVSTRAIAKLLGRGTSSVRALQIRLGLNATFMRESTVVDRVVELAVTGRSGKDIAKAIGRPENHVNAAVTRKFRELGIKRPYTRNTAHASARWTEVNRVLRSAGTRYGLPDGLPLRSVRIVLELCSGPATSDELARRVGIKLGTAYDHLKNLKVLGLISAFTRGQIVRSGGRAHPRRLREGYMLTGHCMDLLSQPTGASP